MKYNRYGIHIKLIFKYNYDLIVKKRPQKIWPLQ
jgi:hypothetical protein